MINTTLPNAAFFDQFTHRAVEGLSIWADANQRVIRKLVDLSALTASESVRSYAELQASALSALRASQEFVLAQQGRLQGVHKDPIGTYQQSVLDSVESAQQAFKLLEASAGTITKSAERLQESAEKASQEIQGTFTEVATQLKTLYSVDGK